ncbi:Rho guanine nucleotide exchange factor 3 [Basidiobolus ranarum]|uniref:Rho guanine nucleotide exchange factor 3 n=1 Tax=Basidiobolus ranarum TaxID=34480 RepID=A0ABR2W494_9FUNG
MTTEHKKVAPLLRVKGRNQPVVRKFKPLPNIPQGHREAIDDEVQDSVDLKTSRIPCVKQRYIVDISQSSESSPNIARHHQANTNYAGNVGVASVIEQGNALRSNQSNNSTAFLKSPSQYDSLTVNNPEVTVQNEIISPNLASSDLKHSSMLKSPNNIRSIHRVRKHSKGSSPPLRSKKSSPSTKPKVYFKRGKISPKFSNSESRDSNKSVTHNLPTFDMKSNPKIAIFNENDEGLHSSNPANDESIVSPSLKVQYLWKDLVKNSKIQCSQPLSPKEIERQETIFELVNTESDYLNCLFVLVEFFKKPLLELGILKNEKLVEIFANLDDILTFHTDLFKRMAAVYKKQFPIINKFAFIFVECLDQMRAYSKFVVNYKRSLSKVAELRQTNKRFSWFLEQRHQKSESRNLSLENLLLEPFQRLCRYPLLFEKILSCTNTDSSDRSDIVQVLSRIRGVIQEINESKERFEIREEMHVAQFRIKGFGYFDFLTPSRELILEGGLTFLNAKEVGQSHVVKVYRQRSLPLRVFLFNDCILLAKHRNKKTGAQYKAIVPPSRVTHVQPVEDAHNTSKFSLDFI